MITETKEIPNKVNEKNAVVNQPLAQPPIVVGGTLPPLPQHLLPGTPPPKPVFEKISEKDVLKYVSFEHVYIGTYKGAQPVRSEVKEFVNKQATGRMLPSGSVDYLFERMCQGKYGTFKLHQKQDWVTFANSDDDLIIWFEVDKQYLIHVTDVVSGEGKYQQVLHYISKKNSPLEII